MYSTAEVADMIGVSKNTLLRWIAEGRLRDVARDWRNWRVWRDDDVERARQIRDRIHAHLDERGESMKADGMAVYATDLTRLGHGRQYRGQ
ncbi:MAG: helix-turn-helix domain-containing protein [Armatimonadetes bacterium]|nr:helix-turn-helix domain-containing protein [Armatimonadota bacterium]